jgi:hypothetical protein
MSPQFDPALRFLPIPSLGDHPLELYCVCRLRVVGWEQYRSDPFLFPLEFCDWCSYHILGVLIPCHALESMALSPNEQPLHPLTQLGLHVICTDNPTKQNTLKTRILIHIYIPSRKSDQKLKKLNPHQHSLHLNSISIQSQFNSFKI